MYASSARSFSAHRLVSWRWLLRSASSAELYALLSALSGCPIEQGIAVTGSVNQLGEMQPIGGVNEKIEGVFRVCKIRGLTGKQGGMIPRANIRNLDFFIVPLLSRRCHCGFAFHCRFRSAQR